MKKYFLIIISILLFFNSSAWAAGTWTQNHILFTPPPGPNVDANFSVGFDNMDSLLTLHSQKVAKQISVGDSGHGTTLQSAVTDIGSNAVTLRVSPGTYNITSNFSISANINLKPERGAVIAIPTGVTLTINGGLDAGPYQIFSCTGTGKVVLGSGSVKEVYPDWWATNTTPGTTDMTAAVQAALTAGAGREVRIGDGEHKITAKLIISNGTTLSGIGWGSILSTSLDLEILSNVGDSSTGVNNVTLRNLQFKNTYPVVAGAGSTKFHVHLINPISALVDHCHFKSAFDDTDYNTANRGGIWFEKISPYYATLNRVTESFVQNSSVRFDTSDSSISNSYVWGHTCDYAIMINDGDINVENCGGIIGSRSHGGIYITALGGPAALQKVIGNYIGGTVPGGDNGYGIYAVAPLGLVINGNTFHQMDGPGIYCQDGLHVSIAGNSFIGGNTKPVASHAGAPDIVIDGVNYNPQNYTITGNTFWRTTSQGDSVEDAIHLQGAHQPANNTFTGNTIYGANRYNVPALNYSVDVRNRLTGNIGHGTERWEGTFAPTLIGSTGGIATCSLAVGYYNVDATGRCFFEIEITASSVAGLSGNLLIGNLPFRKSNAANMHRDGVYFGYFSNITCSVKYTAVTGIFDKNANCISLLQCGTGQPVIQLPAGAAGATAAFVVSGSYIIQ